MQTEEWNVLMLFLNMTETITAGGTFMAHWTQKQVILLETLMQFVILLVTYYISDCIIMNVGMLI